MKHILIDFENVQPGPSELISLHEENCHIWLFLGKFQQKVLPVELCEALCVFGKNVHFIRIAKTGKNALDFYLAYYLGKITEQDPDAHICVLSRDGGFDVLVEHLTDNGHCIVRQNSLTVRQQDDAAAAKISAHNLNEAPAENEYRDEKFIGTCAFKVGKALRESNSFRCDRYDDLLFSVCQTILKNELCEFDEPVKRSLATAIVARLQDKKVLSRPATGEALSYHFTNAKTLFDILRRQVTSARPKTLTALQNFIRTRALNHYFELTADEIDQLINALKQQEILQQTENKIIYPPFSPAAPVIVSAETDPEIVQKASDCLAKWQKNKPGSTDALNNALRSHLKLDERQANLLIQYLAAKNKIVVSETNKIAYK